MSREMYQVFDIQINIRFSSNAANFLHLNLQGHQEINWP